MNKGIDIYQEFSLSRIHSDWSCLLGEEHRLNDVDFRREALRFACQIMRRVKDCLLKIIDQLQREDYDFLEPERILLNPEPGAREWIDAVAAKSIYLPLSLQAWLREVGSVNLAGTHPSWPDPAYLYEADVDRKTLLLTDPLVVEATQEYVEYLHQEWCGETDAIPFRIDIAPDHLHKANISGGLPYQLMCDRPSVDRILLNERHATTFMNYLRLAIQWQGFPGFDYIDRYSKGYPSRGACEI